MSENFRQGAFKEDSPDAGTFSASVGKGILCAEGRVCAGTCGPVGRSCKITCIFRADGGCDCISDDGLLSETVSRENR